MRHFDKRKIFWHSRRGMRELDLLFVPFITEGFDALSESEKKLYEELLLGEDPQPTKHPKIKKARDLFLKWEKLETIINQIDEELIKNNSHGVSEIIKKTISDTNSSF